MEKKGQEGKKEGPKSFKEERLEMKRRNKKQREGEREREIVEGKDKERDRWKV